MNDLFLPGDSIRAMQADRIFTDAIILYGLDIYRGAEMPSWINSDEITPTFRENDEYVVLNRVIELGTEISAASFVSLLEPQNEDYKILKSTLKMV